MDKVHYTLYWEELDGQVTTQENTTDKALIDSVVRYADKTPSVLMVRFRGDGVAQDHVTKDGLEKITKAKSLRWV